MLAKTVGARVVRRVQQSVALIRTGRTRRNLSVSKPLLLSVCIVTLATTFCAPENVIIIDEYVGERNEAGQRDGEGSVIYADGSTYVGGWANDKRAGRGALYLNNGEVHEGHWHDDELNYGTIRYPDGSEYLGSIKNGQPNGLGRKIGKKFCYYGQFRDGKFDGCGALKVYNIRWWKTDFKEYEGQFKDGMRHGVIITRSHEGVVLAKEMWEHDKPVRKVGT